MIACPVSPSRKLAVAGSIALVLTAGAAFSGMLPRSAPQQPNGSPLRLSAAAAAAAPDPVRSQDVDPELIRKLEQEVGGLESCMLPEAFQRVCESVAANLVIHPDVFSQDLMVDLPLSASAREQLDLLCNLAPELTWRIRHGAVYVLPVEYLPLEVRFYDVSRHLEVGDAEALRECLFRLIGDDDSWSWEGTSMQCIGSVLAVSQRDTIHEQMAACLQGMIEPQALPAPKDWRRQIQIATDPGDYHFEGVWFGEVAGALSEVLGVPVLFEPSLLEDLESEGRMLDLDLDQVRADQLVEWICELAGNARPCFRAPALWILRQEPVEIGFFPVQSILDQTGAGIEELQELVQQVVGSGDEHPQRAMESWGELLIVRDTANHLRAVQALLTDLAEAAMPR